MSANKPAYPCYSFETESYESGLTKREYFAAMAMQGLLSSLTEDDSLHNQTLAKSSFEIADEMIKASQVKS